MDEPNTKSVFTSNEPGALSLDEILQQVSKDDQEEWEYEYSTTETETFYLTLELSYPEFKEHGARGPHHSRGGYYKNWTGQDATQETHKLPEKSEQADENSNDEDADGDEAVRPEQDNDDDDGTPLDPALRVIHTVKGKEKAIPPDSSNDKGKQKEVIDPDSIQEDSTNSKDKSQQQQKEQQTEDIQILELHSHHPIISYRHRLFEGSWAEVIGTEAILTQHSPSSPLPALRNLPGDIDILAASCARIMTKEKIPKPRVPEVDTLAPIKEEWNIRIPRGKDRTGERAEQLRFLENLIALKKKRGDTDQVTVYATDGKGKDWDDRKGPDYRPRRKKGALQGQGAEDDGTAKRPAKRSKAKASAASKLRGWPRGFGHNVSSPVPLSTPTPTTWDDLSTEHDRGEQDEDSNGSQDDEADGDVTMTG